MGISTGGLRALAAVKAAEPGQDGRAPHEGEGGCHGASWCLAVYHGGARCGNGVRSRKSVATDKEKERGWGDKREVGNDRAFRHISFISPLMYDEIVGLWREHKSNMPNVGKGVWLEFSLIQLIQLRPTNTFSITS